MSPKQVDLSSVLEDLERRRAPGRRPGDTAIYFGFPLVLALTAFAVDYEWLGVLITVVAILVAWAWFIARKQLAASFKHQLMPLLVTDIDKSFRYRAQGISEAEFNSYGLFDAPDRYESQDRVTGMVGATSIRFALVHAEERVGNDKEHTYVDIFRGLVFSADFNKRISGRTMVHSGKSSFLASLSASHVELEDPRFNEKFHVTSTDQVEARYILTPSLMERIVTLRDRFDDVNISFAGGRLVMALEADYDLLDADPGKPFDMAQVHDIIERVRSVTAIVETLDLNTRIWSKKGKT